MDAAVDLRFPEVVHWITLPRPRATTTDRLPPQQLPVWRGRVPYAVVPVDGGTVWLLGDDCEGRMPPDAGFRIRAHSIDWYLTTADEVTCLWT